MDNNTNEAARLLGRYTGDINELRMFGGEPLVVAVARQGNLELLNLLLERKANPDQASSPGNTALLAAIQRNAWPVALRLIDAGANVSSVNTNAPGSSTPLGEMIIGWRGGPQNQGPQLEVLQQLLDHGADPFAPINHGQTNSILEQVPAHDDPALADLLLTNRPGPARRTPGGDTALHVAVYWGRTNAIDFLLASGFSLTQTNNDGLTPLQCIAGSAPYVKDRLAQGVFHFGFSRITFRATRIHPPIIDLLLSRGATLDVWSAAGLGKTNELSALLNANPAAVNARDSFGRTPLHYATVASETNAAKLLIQSKADVSALTTRQFPQYEADPFPAGWSPLHFAAMFGETEIISLLLQGGAAVDQPDAAGNAPLHFAAQQGWATAQTLLIAAHASLDATNHAGGTALRAAVESGAAGNVELLLKAGAHLKVGSDVESLLDVAADRGSTNAMSVLLRAGSQLEERDAKGRTPFLRAVDSKQWGAMKFLLAKGADINAADARGNTALHQLATQNQESVGHQAELPWLARLEWDWFSHPGVRHNTVTNLMNWKVISQPAAPGWTNTSLTTWLLEHHAKPNLVNHEGQTPLHLLCSQQWIAYNEREATNRVAALLDAGAKADIADSQGLTPLNIAICHVPPAVLSLLMKRMGKLDQFRDNSGQTLLHLAVTNRQDQRLQTVVFLLGQHLNPNARDRLGRTPLHLLVESIHAGDYSRSAEVVDALLKAGADASLRDNKGQTILHRWGEQGRNHWSNFDTIIRQLFALHPDLVNVTNADGDTLLHIAVRSENSQAAQMLMQSGADPMIRNARGESAFYLAQKDSGGYLANVVHPKGVSYNFYFSIATRNQAEFELCLKAEPELANITFNNGQTALMAATHGGRKPKVFADRLLELGAKLDPVSALWLGRVDDARRLISRSSILSSNIWFEAIDLNHFEEMEDLAAAHGDLQALDGEGHTLFYHAATSGQTKAADWLRGHGVRPTFFDAVGLGDTNYLAAVLATNQSLANAPYAHDQTVLMLAARARQRDSARLLIAHGAKIETAGPQGWTALHVASICGANEVAEELLRSDAHPNVTESSGLAPLHLAAMNGFTNMVRLLLDHGASVNQPQPDPTVENSKTLPAGSTPLHWAALCGRLQVIKLLLQSGAEVNATNAVGETPLDVMAVNPYNYWSIPRPSGMGFYAVPRKEDKIWTQIEAELKQAGGTRKRAVAASIKSEQGPGNATAKSH